MDLFIAVDTNVLFGSRADTDTIRPTARSEHPVLEEHGFVSRMSAQVRMQGDLRIRIS